MSRRHDCTRINLGAADPGTRADGWRDILRIEQFGGFYYERQNCGLRVLPPGLTKLLKAARHRSVLDLYAQDEDGFPQSDEQFAESVVRWRGDGLIDERYFCAADLIEGDCSHGAISAPLVTNIQITQACNLRCEHCYTETMAKPLPGEMSLAEISALFDELQALGAPVLIVAGGEPLVRDDLFEILEEAGRCELDTFLCTNATLIKKETARRLAASPLRGYSISLDGPTPEIHDAIRGTGQFERAVRGMRHLADAGVDGVTIRATVTTRSVDHLLGYADVARELGIHRLSIKPFSMAGAAVGAEHLNVDRVRYMDAIRRLGDAWPEDACRLDLGDGMPARPPDWSNIIPPFGCIGGNTTVTVTHDAKVISCAAVFSPEDWSLRQHSFAECWKQAPSIVSWRKLQSTDACGECEQLARCGGGCRARSLGIGTGMADPDPWAYCSDGEPRSSGKKKLVPLPPAE